MDALRPLLREALETTADSLFGICREQRWDYPSVRLWIYAEPHRIPNGEGLLSILRFALNNASAKLRKKIVSALEA